MDYIEITTSDDGRAKCVELSSDMISGMGSTQDPLGLNPSMQILSSETDPSDPSSITTDLSSKNNIYSIDTRRGPKNELTDNTINISVGSTGVSFKDKDSSLLGSDTSVVCNESLDIVDSRASVSPIGQCASSLESEHIKLIDSNPKRKQQIHPTSRSGSNVDLTKEAISDNQPSSSSSLSRPTRSTSSLSYPGADVTSTDGEEPIIQFLQDEDETDSFNAITAGSPQKRSRYPQTSTKFTVTMNSKDNGVPPKGATIKKKK